MAVNITTSDPQGLLNSIYKAIDEKRIETWAYDKDGDFTHTPEQWRHRAWLRPRVRQGQLVLTTLAPKQSNISSVVYAVYHGRFIEMVLSHFDKKFSVASATAMPTSEDNVANS